MTSMRDIKQRIANVSSTEQIIKAMDMIASTKLHKARAQLEGVRPIYRKLKCIVEELGSREGAETHVFYQERQVRNSLYIILTSDRGFSGGYNVNIIAKALEHMDQGKNEKILVVGSKGYEYFKKREKNIIRKITDVADAQMYYGTESVAKWVATLYLSGEVEEVFIAYTHFENVLSYVPYVEKLLPVPIGAIDMADNSDRKYEPDIHTFIDNMIPLYLHMNLFRAFSESHTSEQAARMVSMDAAGKNAEEMIEELTRMYNRKRQTAITQELSEIVGSANILHKGGIDES
ncbi:MAG: ATP synthase F1 subunit gamma [Gracilibacteraceae bacterium]|nr:ATP synthase F1 subunit gamma [Gracilibacteraceae bacterium]